eukprot:3657882-Pyramimonas_sp.AAC.2
MVAVREHRSGIDFSQALPIQALITSPGKIVKIVRKNGQGEGAKEGQGGLQGQEGGALTHLSMFVILKSKLKRTRSFRPAQATVFGLRAQWTKWVESALAPKSGDKRDVMKPVEGAIQHLLADLVSMTVAELEPLERTKIETLITIQVCQRDVFPNKTLRPKTQRP